jgi:GAF domain-containing protein/anti-sigma regulatory factor (Ser/Thr protein kinase)
MKSFWCLGLSWRRKNPRKIEKQPWAKDTKTTVSKKRPTYDELRRELADSLNRVKAIDNEAVRLAQELQDCKRDLGKALEQQKATSEILGLIAGTATNIQAVLNAVANSAARLCEAQDAVIYRVSGDLLERVAIRGSIPIRSEPLRVSRGTVSGRAVVDRQTTHVHDIQAETETEFSEVDKIGSHGGSRARTRLAVPLLRDGIALGAILIRRMEARPFTDQQVALLESFASQAVIAIENVRLFQQLKESLEQQTATSEILGVIASSPKDIQPVLDTVAKNAARLCQAADAQIRLVEGDGTRLVASFGDLPSPEFRSLSPRGLSGRAILTRSTIHVHDHPEAMRREFPDSRFWQVGIRAFLSAPMLREGIAIGVINIRRTEDRPFSQRQIKLLETFAAQAVIAIDNVRLFKELQDRNAELREALEQQTATSEILGVIASSPTEIQPVLETIAQNAAKVTESEDAVIYRVDGSDLRRAAKYGPFPWGPIGEVGQKLSRGTIAGRAVIDRDTVHVPELEGEAFKNEFPDAVGQYGIRSRLATPLLREGKPIGVIQVRRRKLERFTEKQIALLKTFADQAVIAIENVRLFKELQERNSELRETLEHQTATAEVLGIISRSPTEVQPVLDAIVESAARVCGIDDVVLRFREGDSMIARAHHGPVSIVGEELSIDRPQIRWIREHGTLHVPDVAAQEQLPTFGAHSGVRTFLGVPLRQHGELIGMLAARRTAVRPFTEKQVKLLETFADQAVIAIGNVRLFQELQARTGELARSVEELRALGEVGQAVSSTLDLQTVLSTIVARAVELSSTDCGVIYEYDEATEAFHLRASQRMEVELVDAIRAAPLRLGEGYTGQAGVLRAPVQVSDLRNESEVRLLRIRSISDRFGYRSLLTVPILLEDRLMGALTVWRKRAGTFPPELINLLQTFATQSALAIQNARLFREIEDKSRQIEAANRHKSEFLANMSHELRTPLNAIIGFSEVLQERLFGELNEKQAEYTEDILTSGRHLLSLINEILDLSKVEAGRMELEMAPFDLPLAIDNARTFVRERAAKHGITVDLDVDERLGEYIGDARKIKQVLLNLLSNAVKFTPAGGRIGINARPVNGSVAISVTDTGIGIAPEDQPKIFEEFRQVGTDYSHKVEGTGLGLTLAKKFVELHGGRISVESAPGRGSTFTFILPGK